MRVMPSDEDSPLAPEQLPAIAVSIADGLAAVILEPRTRELTETEKAAILGAERVRVFVDARANAHQSRPTAAPIKIGYYPVDTLKFCIEHADYICVGVLPSRHESTPDEIGALLSQFDGKDLGDYVALSRPSVPLRVASPRYMEDTADA